MRAVFAISLLVAGVCASYVPEPSFEPGTVASRDSRFITGPIEAQIIEAIEEIAQAIRDEGLDPIFIEKEQFDFELPVPVLFNAAALLEELLFSGLSNIIVTHINYSLFFSRLDFELELPLLQFSNRVASGDVTLFGNKLAAEANGKLEVVRTTVVGEVRVNIGIISGISISGVTVDFKLGRIISNFRVIINGDNYSLPIHNFITQTVPSVLEEYSAEVNELIEIILLDAINENLDF